MDGKEMVAFGNTPTPVGKTVMIASNDNYR